jgi:hypothetical protein
MPMPGFAVQPANGDIAGKCQLMQESTANLLSILALKAGLISQMSYPLTPSLL